jgi:intracellular sulfur oxidation DsrE/DsrF family protein
MRILAAHRRLACALGAALMFAFMPAFMFALVAPAARAQQAPLQDKPFAEHKIVLQLSDNDPKRQALVISVAYNLLTFYDPDKVAIEVVAFGPGIDLLRTDNANRKLVESLIAQGVRFDVCLNTVDAVERETGKRPEIIPAATPVQVGVGQILLLTENGYTLVRP